MYAQFFGAYLLNKEVIDSDQLVDAIRKLADARIKLGTLAMHEGLMAASEVDEVCYVQTREDKRFGEIAIERGYLTPEQVDTLLKTQTPDYLLLGQNLVDTEALTNSDLERLMADYQADTQIFDMDIESNESTSELINRYLEMSNQTADENTILYLNLLFNNLIRFLGSDFTPLAPVRTGEVPVAFCVTQKINGEVTLESRIEMERDVAIQFASRYARMEFEEFDEYVSASMEDFLNIHNGLFTVNMSNMKSMELALEPPYEEDENIVLELSPNTYVIPIIFPFGTIQIIVTFK